MPEGPSIVILKEAIQQFAGKTLIEAYGDAKTLDITQLTHQKVTAIKSWGKHLLICFNGFTVKIHLLMFGSYLVNEEKETPARIGLRFSNGYVNFYTCSVKLLEGNLDLLYDWSTDVMNDSWDEKSALTKLEAQPNEMICDALLDQQLFSGVGNIIKNEILFRVGVHPESKSGNIPIEKRKRLIQETRIYSFQFLEWKKQHILKQQWKAHTKKTCPKCNGPMTFKITGLRKRRSFFCEKDQPLYS